jgi:HK97 family phage major capsid protein
MSDLYELIKSVYEKRRKAVDAQQALVASVEAAGGVWSAEDEAEHQRINTDIDALGARVDSLLATAEQAKVADEQRARFEAVIRPDETPPTKDLDEQMRSWLRAALPDSDVWQPRALRFSIDSATKAAVLRSRGMEARDLTKGSDAAGGYTVPTGFVARLYEHMIEAAAVRQTGATILTTSSGENLLVPKTTGHGAAVLVTEANALSESDPVFDQVTLSAYKFGQLIQLSTELIQDTAIDLLGYIARAAGLALGTVTGTYFVTGTGTSQPQGVANSPTVGKTGTTGQTLTVTGGDLIDLYHSVVSAYRRNGTWLMNDLSLAIVRKIRDDTGGTGLGNFLWQPGLSAGAPDLLLGRPVVTDPNVAVMAANAYSIAFGDFSLFYTIRDVDGVRFERSDDFAFANDLVSFRAIIRTDGRQVVNGSASAVKFYRNSAT